MISKQAAVLPALRKFPAVVSTVVVVVMRANDGPWLVLSYLMRWTIPDSVDTFRFLAIKMLRDCGSIVKFLNVRGMFSLPGRTTEHPDRLFVVQSRAQRE